LPKTMSIKIRIQKGDRITEKEGEYRSSLQETDLYVIAQTKKSIISVIRAIHRDRKLIQGYEKMPSYAKRVLNEHEKVTPLKPSLETLAKKTSWWKVGVLSVKDEKRPDYRPAPGVIDPYYSYVLGSGFSLYSTAIQEKAKALLRQTRTIEKDAEGLSFKKASEQKKAVFALEEKVSLLLKETFKHLDQVEKKVKQGQKGLYEGTDTVYMKK